MNSKVKSCAVCHAHFVDEMAVWALDDERCSIPTCSTQCAEFLETISTRTNGKSTLPPQAISIATMGLNSVVYPLDSAALSAQASEGTI